MGEPLNFLIRSAFDSTGVTAAVNSINKMDSLISRTTKSFDKLFGLFAGGAAGSAVFGFLNGAVTEFAKEEREILKLNKALENLGITDSSVSKDIVKFTENMSFLTKATQEEIIASATSLTQRGLWGAELKKAITTSLDLATKTGSLSTATDMVGKAFQGVTKGLNTIGVQLDKNIPKTQVYAETMRQLDTMFGGAAQAEMAGYAGRVEALGKRYGELKESLGSVFVKPANWSIAWLEDLAFVLDKIGDKLAGTKDKTYEAQVALVSAQREFIVKMGHGTAWEKFWLPDYSEADKQAAYAKVLKAKADLAALTNAAKPNKGVTPNRATGAVDDTDTPAERERKKREHEKYLEQIADIESFSLTERGQLYTRYFGKINMEDRKSTALRGTTAKQLEINSKKMLLDLERDYEAASKTLAGGWKQAMDEMSQAGLNWKQGFEGAVSASMGPATEAFKTFFNMSKSGFGDMGKLAEGVFRGIRDAFYNMVTQMVAKWAVLNIFGLISGTGGVNLFSGLLSRDSGGPIPGSKGSAMPILAHGGEFMLSANVVDAIKAGRPTASLSANAVAAGSANNTNITQNFNVTGGSGNVDELCNKIAEAARKGVSSAVTMSSITYKVGAKRSGLTSL